MEALMIQLACEVGQRFRNISGYLSVGASDADVDSSGALMDANGHAALRVGDADIDLFQRSRLSGSLRPFIPYNIRWAYGFLYDRSRVGSTRCLHFRGR